MPPVIMLQTLIRTSKVIFGEFSGDRHFVERLELRSNVGSRRSFLSSSHTAPNTET
jgi:hypothetical protein